VGTLMSVCWLVSCDGFAPLPCEGLLGRAFRSTARIPSASYSFRRAGMPEAACPAAVRQPARRTPRLRMSEEEEGEGEFPLSQSMSIGKALGTDKPEEMFRLTDTDSSGGLDFDEFSSVFGGLGMGLGYAEMRALFDEMDLNKDGQISLHEFKTRMEKDLAEAQDAAMAAIAVAATAEQEGGGTAAGAGGDGSMARLELVKSKADEAQKWADEMATAVNKLGLS